MKNKIDKIYDVRHSFHIISNNNGNLNLVGFDILNIILIIELSICRLYINRNFYD